MRARRSEMSKALSGVPTRSWQRSARPEVVSPGRAHPTSESIIELQRTAGNRAVTQLLSRRDPVSAAVPVVQRAPYGLDIQTSQDTYVDRAVKLWTTKRGMSVTAFATDLLQTIGVELKGYGVPHFGWKFLSGAGAAGIFDSQAWKVLVNVSKFSSRGTTPKTLKDLSIDEVTDVVGTLYHEARHTDQDVVIIRSLLDQKKTVDQIFAETKIRKDVIKAVSATKYATALDADQRAHAGRMFDVMYGAHKEFLEFLIRHSAAVEGLGKLAKPGSRPTAAAAHLKTLANWQSSVLQPKLKKLAAVQSPTSAAKDLVDGLQKIDASLTDLLAGWKKVSGVKKPAAADVDDLRDLANDAVFAIIEDTYKKLEGEADAFRVEEEIKTAFAKKAAKP